MKQRRLLKTIQEALKHQSAIGILGPRQVGKTTLAREIASQLPSLYLDLESPADVQKLSDPLSYLATHQDKLIILDEIQRMPDLFQILRVLIDQSRQAGKKDAQFLILGSASLELMKQASETLAGRIHYYELCGFDVLECLPKNLTELEQIWFRGGFPNSYLAATDMISATWRENFIRTYLERDIPQLGPRVPANTLHRFWTMLAHLQGTNINTLNMAKNIDVSTTTIKRYLDLLVDLLLMRSLQPWFRNVGKRLVKSPKYYVRDSGITHQLLSILNKEQLLSNPVVGKSWEGFVIENLLAAAPEHTQAFYYRSAAGAEIDLLLQISSQELWAIEIKRSTVPKVDKGFYSACEDIHPSRKYVVYTGEESYTQKHGVSAIGLVALMEELNTL